MNNLFELKNNQVVIQPEAFPIPEFKILWDRDKSKGKDQAYKELCYVYYFTDFKSPYNSYPEAEREKIIIKDFMRDEKWQPDSTILDAVLKYQKFQDSPSMRMLKASRAAQEKLTKYMETGECDVDVKELMTVLSNIGKSIESVDKVEEKVKKELSSNEKIRGGGNIKSRER